MKSGSIILGLLSTLETLGGKATTNVLLPSLFKSCEAVRILTDGNKRAIQAILDMKLRKFVFTELLTTHFC